MVAISLVIIVIRVFCKYRLRVGLGWDDWVLIASWIMLLISASLTSWIITLGYGKHIKAIDPSVLSVIGLGGYLSGAPAVFAIVWSKTSFAIMLLRVVEGRTKYFVWFIIISMNLFMTMSVINIWISCHPVEKLYNPSVPGSCWPVNVVVDYATFSGAYSAAMDIILALLPWKVIMILNMRRAEKVGVALAMSMGIFAGAAAIAKVTQFRTMSGGDFTYEGASLVIWGVVEAAVTIVAASIPVLRVLIRDANKSWHGSRRTRTQTNRGCQGTINQTPIWRVLIGVEHATYDDDTGQR
ncbi:hypothetical protein B0J12DRAFT_764519 [Macrophomina phaseolina]|uniref:Rhodopsin domain-containing protein n=1 Tax=Macrophomina phaseolina TaxID=35725 RepID=A0ABQ8G025_9PEZI|nr:hypothetical protein B0J12DRAFT_764519 [Macrophomina phaseolina]